MGKLLTVCYKCGSRSIEFVKRVVKNGAYNGKPNSSQTREIDAYWCKECQKYRCLASEEVIAKVYDKHGPLLEELTKEEIERYMYRKNPFNMTKGQIADYMSSSSLSIIVQDHIDKKYNYNVDVTYELTI